MSRTQSQGIDYFPLAIDFFSDKRIRILKARYGADGIAICIYIFCTIYREGFYTKVDEDLYFVVADDLKVSSDTVRQVLKFLLERSMFDNTLFLSDTILTSTGIQERWQKAVATRAAKTPIEVDAKYWLLEPEKTRPFIQVTHFSDSSKKKADSSKKKDFNSENYPQRKGKKRKVNTPSIEGVNAHAKESPKRAYGSCKNVLLTDEELDRLKKEIPNEYERYLEHLSKYMRKTGKQYDDHCFVILSWVKEDAEKAKEKNQEKQSSFDYKELDRLFS